MLILLFFLGLVFGSFCNVLIYRLPLKRSIGGRSGCMTCGRTLSVFELIPVLSYVLQRGRCRGCHTHISLQYPLIECTVGLLFVAAFLLSGGQIIPTGIIGIILALFLVIAIVDARTQMIPDSLSLSIIVLALFLQFFTHTWAWSGLALGVCLIGFQWMVSRGTWVGSGDILLIAAIGLLLGPWQRVLLSLMLAYIIGALYAVMLIIRTRTFAPNARIAFGPFLIIGACISLLWGESIFRLLSVSGKY